MIIPNHLTNEFSQIIIRKEIMWNLLTAIIVVCVAFIAKPTDPDIENIVNQTLHPSVVSQAQQTSNPKNVAPDNSNGNTIKLVQNPAAELTTTSSPTPTATIDLKPPTVTPTPIDSSTPIPTIHIQEPPNGFLVKPTHTPTPTPTGGDLLPIDPLPTRNPCYCDPSKERACIDIYSC